MAQEWLGTLLHRALRERHIDEVRRFALAGADLEVHNEMGQTSLYVAAAAGMDKAVKVLLGFGADVEAVDGRGGHPPIHIASSRGHEEVVRLLLEHGADIDYRDPDQWTALHQAVHFGHIETARLLFDRGADWTIRTTDDKMTVLERATQRGRIEIILMLAHLSDNQNKELCQKCLGITIPDLLQPEKEGEDWWRSGYLHHSSEESLKQSARNCNGCLLISRSLGPKPEGKEYPGSIRLRAYSYKDPDLSYECITTVTAVVDTGGREGGLDLAADEGSAAATYGRVAKRLPYIDQLSSRHTEIIKHWVQDCIDNHSMCNTHDDRPQDSYNCATKAEEAGVVDSLEDGTVYSKDLFPSSADQMLPRRLLDLESMGDDSLCTITDQVTEKNKYAALSYCWGGKATVETTKSNLASHQIGIKKCLLPKTIFDAINATRRLGIRYLWVDALCIVQDDETDWKSEASKMGQIYRRAVVTLAATISTSSTYGLYSRRRGLEHVALPYRTDDGTIDGQFYLRYDGNRIDIEKSRWNGRGWTLQERFLSPRIIHFGEEDFFLECQKTTVRVPFMTLPSIPNGWTTHEEVLANRRRCILQEFEMADWLAILEDYTSRHLTELDDKFPAIYGLVQQVQQRTKWQYSAGVWHFDITTQLLWIAKGFMRHPPKPRAPSWSWAAMDGPVVWRGFPAGLKMETFSDHGTTTAALELKAFEFQRPQTPNAYIRGVGQMVRVEIEKAYAANWETWYPPGGAIYYHLSDAGSMDHRIGKAILDEQDPGEGPFWILRMRDVIQPYRIPSVRGMFHVLVLKKIGPTCFYKRVGVGEIEKSDFFNAVDPVAFELL